ncbi:MAG: alpha/beta hydrolase [Tsuneonella suprasediminis]|nr:alpha/beta hydrolase [Altererythrobacter sp. N1]
MADLYVKDDVRALLAMLEQIGGPEIDEVPVADARAQYAAMGALAEADPRPLPVKRDLTCPGPAGDIPLRLYDPRDSREAGPVVMFFHGGGFVIGDLETHDAFCTEIAHQLDLPVVAVHYRLAPEATFPAAADDCEAATRWVAGNPAELGREATGLVTTGDSAGGNLTIVVSQALAAEAAAVPVIVQAPIYPVASAIEETDSYRDFGEGFLLTARTMNYFTSSYAPDESSTRMYPALSDRLDQSPPTVIVTAGLDPLRDSGRDYAKKLISHGIDVTYMEVPGIVHGFVNLRKALPSAQAASEAFLAEVKQMLARYS